MAFEFKPHNVFGGKVDPALCKASVWHPMGVGGRHAQCKRKKWKDGWCKQHHPDTEQARKDAWDAKFQADNKKNHAKWKMDTLAKHLATATLQWASTKSVHYGNDKRLKKLAMKYRKAKRDYIMANDEWKKIAGKKSKEQQ